jgi:hypothetical protein
MHLVEEMSNMTNMVGDGFLLQIGQCWAWFRYTKRGASCWTRCTHDVYVYTRVIP